MRWGLRRASTIERIRLGAAKAGRLTAIGHESWSGNLGDRPEAATAPTRLLYAGANRMTRLMVAHLDLPEASAMRAPGEMPGMMTLEIAMDELAESWAWTRLRCACSTTPRPILSRLANRFRNPTAARSQIIGAMTMGAGANATGIRVRDYPITLDRLLDRLP